MTTHLAMAPPSIRQAAQTARHVPSRPVRRRPGWRRFGWMPLAPAAVTLAVMLSGITSSSYWGDETATISAVSRPLPRLIAMLGHVDVVHGLYYLLIWPIAQVAGTSELVMRLPSAVAMAAAALGIAAIGRRLSSPLAGLLAGLAFAAEPVVSLWGQDARPYAMTVAAAVLASWLLLPVLERPGAARLAAYAASVALLGYLSLTCLLLVAAHAVTVGRAWRTAPD
ncbi:MAG: glycosyltransferase family 39 protein, partial [Nocardiopsaceae bacterium]|nr:glycosyltransferase family 39 protein [Nocardiopsaceae bacterium]